MQSFGFGEQLVRAVDRAGAAWFVGNDVCAALELGNTSMALRRLEEEERDEVSIVDPIGREQRTTIISESGMYALAFTSRKEAAKRFRRWVTQEVLPALRMTGEYRMPANDTRPAPRVVDLEGALGTADDRHAIKTALLTINTYTALYGQSAGRAMLEKLGFPVPGVDMPAVMPQAVAEPGATVPREGDIHVWSTAAKVMPSRRDATNVGELYAHYSRWCGQVGAVAMAPRRFRDMMVMIFGHEEHPELIKVIFGR